MEPLKEPANSFVDKLAALVAREANECPVCSQRVEYLMQVDGYVCAQPCACRLWQGKVPPTWWDSEM